MPVLSKHFDVPQVLDADSVILYPTGSSSTVAGVSLLVPMSPTFGEPVLLEVNHRNTDLNALQDETDTDAIEKKKRSQESMHRQKTVRKRRVRSRGCHRGSAALLLVVKIQKTSARTQLFTGLQ